MIYEGAQAPSAPRSIPLEKLASTTGLETDFRISELTLDYSKFDTDLSHNLNFHNTTYETNVTLLFLQQ